MRDKERERERQTKRERQRERETVPFLLLWCTLLDGVYILQGPDVIYGWAGSLLH